MLEHLYPLSERRLFVNRKAELARLAYARQQLQQGRPQAANLSLFGLRRTGKTMLLKEFALRTLERSLPIVPVYLNLEHVCSSPETFALRLIGALCYWYGQRGEGSPRPFMTFDSLLLEAAALPSPVIRQHLEWLQREWRASRPDRPFLLTMALGLAEELAAESGLYFILIFDEFQAIETLRNYRETRHIMALMREAFQRQDRVAYILAGSAITAMTRLVSDAQSPLFVQLERLSLPFLTREATTELVARLIPGLDDSAVFNSIYRLTRGHPFYTTQLSDRLAQIHHLQELPLNEETVKLSFVTEALSPRGRIYDFCKYVYELSLQRARGYGSLQSVLQILSDESPLPMAELARQMRVSYSTARGYVRWLVEVDILTEVKEGYTFRDPVLRYWIAHITRGVEVDSIAHSPEVWELVAHLDERFRQAATELGRAKEAEVRELMRHFAGQRLSGAFFGLEEDIVLPAFSRVAAYRSADGQVEVDALAENDERWAAEVKWRSKAAGKKELTGLLQKAQSLNARPWFISRSGFTPAALTYAAEQGILVSARSDLESLSKSL